MTTYDLLDKSGRAFPTLLPQGANGPRRSGPAYQNAKCTAKERSGTPRLEVEPLVSSPWLLAWDCEKAVENAENPLLSQDYVILVYDSPATARAVVSQLPPHDTEAGTKNGNPYTSHQWRVPDGVTPGGMTAYHTVNRVVSFENDPERSNSLVFISVWGTTGERLPSGVVGTAPPYAQDKVRAWWDAATL
ncbi:hypothetical protein IU434_00105 [Nocardia farcinica]|uniref:hypothetical protein n=1 Tax=Nocardia farcinica TaxID=37329 RepID=UPI00189585FC|nr:hypothetical protein [Nocardia farcinica]MBF6440417.1 hypothetical protein [Nocardia farcinica]